MQKITDILNIDIQSWINLYNACISINDLKPQMSKDFVAFKTKQGNPIRLGQVSECLNLIPQQVSYYKFFQNNKLFWIIPVELPDCTIVGFILKSYSKKEYRTVSFSKYNPFFGLYDFNDFTKNKLVVLTEGSKDCLYIKQHYKYTLALNTSKVTNKLISIIKYLTRYVLLIYDNDDTGYFQQQVNVNMFKSIGVIPFTLKYQLKDPGEYFLASSLQKQQFNNELDKIINFINR